MGASKPTSATYYKHMSGMSDDLLYERHNNVTRPQIYHASSYYFTLLNWQDSAFE